MLYKTWFFFFIFSCFTSIAPGSGAIISMLHGLRYGWKKTSITILGQELALALMLIVIICSLEYIIMSHKILLFVIKIIGSFWLLYLGYTYWNAPIEDFYLKDNLINLLKNLTPFQRFSAGFITNITNPKIIIFMFTMIPKFIDNSCSLLDQLFIMIITITMVDTIVMHLYAYWVNKIKHVFYNKDIIKIKNRILGGVFIVMALSIFI